MHTRPHSSPGRARGFTLIELMIALVIATILVTLAIASYSAQLRKSRRTEAKTAVLNLAGREEQNFSTTNTYSSVPSQVGYGAVGATFPMVVGSGYYTINVVVTAGAAGVPATYTITATPVAGSDQAKDLRCTSFTVTQTGVQTATGTDAANCWK